MQSPHMSYLAAQRLALPLTAALALVCSAACRDLKADPGYCPTCALDGAISAPATSVQADPALGMSAGTVGTSQSNQPNATAGTSVPASVAGSGGVARTGTDTAATANGNSAGGRSGSGGLAQAGKPASGSGGIAGSSALAGAGARAAGQGGASGGSDASPGERDAGVDAGPMMTLPCGATCGGNTPVCDEFSRSCVECTSNDTHACIGERSACDANNKKCVECVNDQTCAGAKPTCDTQQQRCVTCLRNKPDSCRSELPVCDEEAQMCVECLPGQTNACRGNRRQCEPGQKLCVECLNANDCPTPEHPVCQLNQCMGCVGQQDCRGRFQNTPVCDQSRGVCVACVADSDCIAGQQRCDMSKHTCEAIPPPPPPPGTKQACDSCTNDNECAGAPNAPAACAQHANFGNFCFAGAQGQCPGGYSAQRLNGKQGTYCVPANTVSCEALKSVGKGCQTKNQCGGGGECAPDHCTIRCEDDNQCPKEHSHCREIPLFMPANKYCQDN